MANSFAFITVLDNSQKSYRQANNDKNIEENPLDISYEN
jgi:hypothetical protein